MMRRIRVLILASVATLFWSGTALAGGWAVTVINDAPAELGAGTEHQITYTILQHGRTPAQVKETSLDFMHPYLKEVRSFPGEPTDKPGEYVATVMLPTAGSWGWEVNQGGFGVQELGMIEVSPAGSNPLTSGGVGVTPYLLLAGTLLATVLFATQWQQLRRHSPASPQSVV